MNGILRWAGSKRQLLSKLKEHWPGGQVRYVEPFCGSACLFFATEPSEAILGDLNSELIETYQTLKTDCDCVIERLCSMRRSKETYYRIRALDVRKLGTIERAARFLYLNRHCFNGIYRTNALGEFNVPYGPQKHDSKVNDAGMRKAAKQLQNALLIPSDFSGTLKHVRHGDFVYLDPPYVVRKRRVFREYHPDSFSEDDLEILSEWLVEIDRRGARFVVSYGDSPEARRLLKPWCHRRARVRRNVAGFSGNRRCAFELIGTNS